MVWITRLSFGGFIEGLASSAFAIVSMCLLSTAKLMGSLDLGDLASASWDRSTSRLTNGEFSR